MQKNDEDNRYLFIQENEHSLLIRIDERLKGLNDKMETYSNRLAEFERHYVTRKEFNPVKNIVFSMVGVVLFTVFVALVNSIINN